ncbi:response regulator [Dactylosporangium sp. NBC_01737]|uniref:response regulator n=1 Tax=Dactylosporangium sp. NBC_01737 TaxID=2975959 RepID=UPI002E13CE2D|nr:response regulator [Dactylosporangium sp. NBC_01737]
MLSRSLGEHIHLITSLDRQLWPLYADASQLEQILVNLAVNARDAMPTGGTPSIDTSNAELGNDAGTPLQPGRYVRLRVSDTGTPATAAPVSHQTTEPATRTSPHETILMDEDDLRQITARILTRAGYQVLSATGGTHAIHLAHTHPGPIHLLPTDVIMPKMLGNEVAAQVRQRRPDLSVLYMSGYAGPVLTENGTLPDGVTIVEKPFTSRELLDRVYTILHTATRTRDAVRQ